ncbi:MAG: AraC family transcriptional regulator [Mangrovibacterium sp.]
MKDFFKYLNPSVEDKAWGMHILVIGKSTTKAHQEYPSREHPNGYYFTWENGRTINGYQIIFITEGEGVVENKHGIFQVTPGSVIIIRDDEWHRYKPLDEKGWVEHYVGFNGMLANHFLCKNKVLQGQTVINCGFNELIYQTYTKLFDIASKEYPGSQHVASSCIIELLANIASWEKQKHFTDKPIAKVIEYTKMFMREHIYGEIDLAQIACDNNITYSYLRRMFKSYTGISPHQYFLDMKLLKARELLITGNLTIKEISYKMGFSSEHYFSRIFKKKTGLSPSSIRK